MLRHVSSIRIKSLNNHISHCWESKRWIFDRSVEADKNRWIWNDDPCPLMTMTMNLAIKVDLVEWNEHQLVTSTMSACIVVNIDVKCWEMEPLAEPCRNSVFNISTYWRLPYFSGNLTTEILIRKNVKKMTALKNMLFQHGLVTAQKET